MVSKSKPGGGSDSGRSPLMLSVIGAINWDISIFEERFARAGEEVPVKRLEEFSGGKGANVAVASARVLGRGRAAYIGALGDDEIRELQLAALAAEGVVVDGVVEVRGCQSGRAYILIDAQGRKTIHTHFGANERITPRHLREGGCADVISRTGTMIVMDPPTPVALAAARAASKSGAKVIYSPGVRTQEGVKTLETVMEISDFLVVDRIELMNLYKGHDEEEVLGIVNDRHPQMTVVATLGSSGCIVARGGSVSRVAGVEVSSLGRKVVNTTGCGDAFLGVFASYLLMGRSPLESASWANLAGALKATRLETRGSPSRKELERSMRLVETGRLGAFGLRNGSS
ncbi:MAG: PfkB family carbohydrate kinase [Thaumarchaeota archaeon]|nr:PfkB family carbohydrate kinase [Nitrososphaerota archaeon]